MTPPDNTITLRASEPQRETPREAQLRVRHMLVTPRMGLEAIERMLHEGSGDVGPRQAEAWAAQMEDFAEQLIAAAGEMRKAARCGGWVQGVDARRMCVRRIGHLGDCSPR